MNKLASELKITVPLLQNSERQVNCTVCLLLDLLWRGKSSKRTGGPDCPECSPVPAEKQCKMTSPLAGGA